MIIKASKIGEWGESCRWKGKVIESTWIFCSKPARSEAEGFYAPVICFGQKKIGEFCD